MKISVVDFFSGCGGTSLGLKHAGMSIVAGIDNDPNAAATYRSNFPRAKFFERDIRELDVNEVAAAVPRGGPILFSGCAPCQPFSKHNASASASDPRRSLLGEFARFVVEILPDFVVVENVPGLQRVGSGGPLFDFVDDLHAAGYSVNHAILSAQEYGVPQIRRRLVLIASRLGDAPIPSTTHGGKLRPPSTVRDWITGLPELAAGETDASDPDHSAMYLSETNLRRIRATPEGGGRENWNPELLLDCHQEHRGHSDVYGRLAWDRAAAAMTTRCLSYSNGRFGHPDQDRAISLREAACLQTFPRTFQFAGSLTSRGRQVGNAVPPLLAKRIGQSIVGAAKDTVAGTR